MQIPSGLVTFSGGYVNLIESDLVHELTEIDNR